VKAQAARVKDTFTDGINVDIEDALKADQTQDKRLLTVLMHELKGELDREVIDVSLQLTRNAMRIHLRLTPTKVPNHQLTFDVAWNPDCVDERCYDYKARPHRHTAARALHKLTCQPLHRVWPSTRTSSS
jgi:hypothetical protein